MPQKQATPQLASALDQLRQSSVVAMPSRQRARA
jgi:hypothetical protein